MGPIFLLAGAVALVGCAGGENELRIVDHRAGADPVTFAETFEEAYYSLDGVGNIDIVLESTRPAQDGGGAPFAQTVHIRTFWRCQPGRTVAHRTQLNATIHYRLETPAGVQLYAGAGAVMYWPSTWDNTVFGEVTEVHLEPYSTDASEKGLFEHPVLEATFRAVPDARRTRRIANEFERWFANPPELID
jgi:hypothetical protein